MVWGISAKRVCARRAGGLRPPVWRMKPWSLTDPRPPTSPNQQTPQRRHHSARPSRALRPHPFRRDTPHRRTRLATPGQTPRPFRPLLICSGRRRKRSVSKGGDGVQCRPSLVDLFGSECKTGTGYVLPGYVLQRRQVRDSLSPGQNESQRDGRGYITCPRFTRGGRAPIGVVRNNLSPF